MKWYLLAHLAAVTMSCLCAEVRALQYMQLCPNFASGIARALPSLLLYMYIFEFPDARCRPQVSFSVNLKPFQGFRGGKLKPCTYGVGIGKSRWGGTPSYAKTADLSGSIFFLARARRSLKNRHSIHFSSSCRGKHLILHDFAMVIVKFRLRWPLTWRYALHSLLRPTMTSGRLG